MLAKTVKYKKKKDADLQSKHKFNGRDPEQNYFDNSPKKDCTRQPSIFYLSVSTVSYNEAYHLTSLVEARTPF